MAKTLMLLSGAHPVHKRFGEIGCDTSTQLKQRAAKEQSKPSKFVNLFRSSLSIPSNFDYIVCESCYYYPAIKKRFRLLGKSKIINMSCGPLFHHLLSGRISGLERKVLLSLLGEVDGHLVYGTYGKEILNRLNVRKPANVIYPFISDDSLRELSNSVPDCNSKSIVIIATSDLYNKGFDLLFSAMQKIAEYDKEIKLKIVTRVSEEEVKQIPGFNSSQMTILRNIPNICDIFSDASLYIQPSRSDMFPVACIEAMAAGVPCIVSIENGMKEFVQKIDPSMVVSLDEQAIADSIINYFKKSKKEKAELSNLSRKTAAFFNERDMLNLFVKELEDLKSKI